MRTRSVLDEAPALLAGVPGAEALWHPPRTVPDGRTACELHEKRIHRITDATRASAAEHDCTFHQA